MAQVEVVNGDDFDLPRRYRSPPSKMEHEVHGPTQNGPGLVNGDEAGGAGDANEERERSAVRRRRALARILGDDILQRRRLLVRGLELGHRRHLHGLRIRNPHRGGLPLLIDDVQPIGCVELNKEEVDQVGDTCLLQFTAKPTAP